MRTVAIVGSHAETQRDAHSSSASEFWSLGTAYKSFGAEKLTRYFELHPRWMLESDVYNPGHLAALEAGVLGDVPIVWAGDYPLRAALRLCSGLFHGGRRQRVFTSTVDFLSACALLEGFERIEYYGCDMGSSTEYLYQVPGFAFWCGFAAARGVEVHLPANSFMMRSRIYAYEIGAQMISRQHASQELVDYQNAVKAAQQKLNFLNGVAAERQRTAEDARTQAEQELAVGALQEAITQIAAVEQELFLASGAEQALQRLIDVFDMKEPTPVRNKFRRQETLAGEPAQLNGAHA